MFTTKIDGKEIKVTFQHQITTASAPLTRPEMKRVHKRDYMGIVQHFDWETIRVPIYANCFCFFDDMVVGVAWCSLSDRKRYSKEIGRQLSLRSALKSTLKRSGRKDDIVAEERAGVWDSYFRSSTTRAKTNPLVIGRALHRMANEVGTLTDIPTPMPSEKDMNHSGIPWKLGHMPDEVRGHLNQQDADSDFHPSTGAQR